jgi:hypothetical protein
VVPAAPPPLIGHSMPVKAWRGGQRPSELGMNMP